MCFYGNTHQFLIKFHDHLLSLYRLYKIFEIFQNLPRRTDPFADESMDIMHGEAVLHHLDISMSSREIARVLKPGAKAAFKDLLGAKSSA